MVRFFDPTPGNATADTSAKLHAPATSRNRDAILAVLKDQLPESGTLVEIASGTGEHAAFMAPQFPGLFWQPTDIDPAHLKSIEAWRQEADAPNLLEGRKLNVLRPWPLHDLPAPVSVIAAINLIHISPWAVAEALVAKAGEILAEGGVLYLYGPYKRGGEHTAPSNAAFDVNLKANDPLWGVRDLEAVAELAARAGFDGPTIVPMPANNFSLVFRK